MREVALLDFVLVLGHVPGTNIDITFMELVIGLPVLLVLLYILRRYRGSLRRRLNFGHLHFRQAAKA